ncbi:MAG: polyprenyl synthetase family protein [Bacteroidales bacterium]|nr:polyprenyl synthetase family protein [Bacteroidales bacterium]
MSALDPIKQPIAEELDQFEHFFKGIMKTNVPLLNLVIKYLLKRKGKQMRPILVFLTARLLGKPNASTYTAAALIEIMHTASLIHDDVVDDSHERRGFFSINAIWKSKVSVLLGDYLLSRGLLLAVNNKEYEILGLVSEAVKEMTEGELLQIKNSRKLSISQDEYHEIIRKKTAALLACCSASGAKSVAASDEVVKQMHRFGELLGIAFQIKDDLLDYQLYSASGKPSGNDLKDRKLTLPLIHALEIAESSEKRKILRLLNKSVGHSQEFNEVLGFVEKNEGLTYAEKKMKEYASSALAMLDSFPDIEIKDSMRSFVEFTILRNK